MGNLPALTRQQAQYVQLYRSAMRSLRGLALESPTAHAVLYVLMERMNTRNALIASQETLAKLIGKSRPTIARSLAELRKRNYIELVRVGNLSVIVINKRVAWTAETKLRSKLAIFDAQVIALADEQENPELLGREPPLLQLPPVLIPPELGSLIDDDDPTIAGQQELPHIE